LLLKVMKRKKESENRSELSGWAGKNSLWYEWMIFFTLPFIHLCFVAPSLLPSLTFSPF
jgi:hypothetical protein